MEKTGGDKAQVVECLPSNLKALSSKPLLSPIQMKQVALFLMIWINLQVLHGVKKVNTDQCI
jgi:hypothetical protein